MYAFLTGPMLWVAFLVFFGGCLFHIITYVKGLNWSLDRVAYGYENDNAVRGALKSLLHWVVPFYSRSWRRNPIFCLMFFALHIPIVLIPLFLTGHVVFLQQRWGISWPTLPAGLADFLTIMAMVAAVAFVIRRAVVPYVRIITKPMDIILMLVTIAPFVTGYVAAHQSADYEFWLSAHVVTAEIWLIAVPFTKLAHVVLFFCSRIQLGMDFGIKRGGAKGRGIVW